MSSWPSGRSRSRTIRLRHVIEKQLDLLALLPAHINPPTRPLPFHGELPAIDHLVGQLPSAMFWQSSTFRTWQIYRLASSLLPTMSTFSTLNAGLTLEPSRRFPYSLGVAILITVKFHMFPSAIYAISFRLEFAKLGTSAFPKSATLVILLARHFT